MNLNCRVTWEWRERWIKIEVKKEPLHISGHLLSFFETIKIKSDACLFPIFQRSKRIVGQMWIKDKLMKWKAMKKRLKSPRPSSLHHKACTLSVFWMRGWPPTSHLTAIPLSVYLRPASLLTLQPTNVSYWFIDCCRPMEANQRRLDVLWLPGCIDFSPLISSWGSRTGLGWN